MKKTFFKNCNKFKPIFDRETVHNKALNINCSNCIYFSSANCHKDILDEIPYEADFF